MTPQPRLLEHIKTDSRLSSRVFRNRQSHTNFVKEGSDNIGSKHCAGRRSGQGAPKQAEAGQDSSVPARSVPGPVTLATVLTGPVGWPYGIGRSGAARFQLDGLRAIAVALYSPMTFLLTSLLLDELGRTGHHRRVLVRVRGGCYNAGAVVLLGAARTISDQLSRRPRSGHDPRRVPLGRQLAVRGLITLRRPFSLLLAHLNALGWRAVRCPGLCC